MKYTSTVEQWGIFELELHAERTFSNPFQDVRIFASFRCNSKRVQVEGFYDGDDTWKVRFMPDEPGTYVFSLESDFDAFDGLTGTFTCTPAKAENHGPVRVQGQSHFVYADGTPFFVMGTTAYAWTYRPEEVRRKTLTSFVKYGFNKIRMLFFPKYYRGGMDDVNISYDPPVYPFAGEPEQFDFKSPNPVYFQNFENRVMDLMQRGIEADVILFHPYDRWGIDRGMRQEDDLFYVRYMIARLGAYRNVWWSLANEYDISYTDTGKLRVGTDRKDWDLIGSFIKSNDPYGHPISCHNISFGYIYPDRDWISHVSYQHPDTYTLMLELKNRYKKPVINDEYQYEGNVKDDWGNCDAETTLFRHWLSVMAGGYASHGEVFKIDGNDRDLFWSYGGTIVGESAPRLKFMKQIVQSCSYQEMERDHINTDGHHYFSLSKGKDEYLIFCRYDLPGKKLWFGPYDGTNPDYEATIYDVWNCEEKGTRIINRNSELPITEWAAIRLVKK